MGRAPCCEKTGVKRGPWTIEEDQILISYIQQHGHANWRALPKEAGLLRCGKSCRLRWINYLRPDIKRGNFSNEEEEAIIKLHELLGNRWSSIAAKLPGRTDNEIKNVWHTHLKKRLKNNSTAGPKFHSDALRPSEPVKSQNLSTRPASQPPSSGDLSSATDSSAAGSIYTNNEASTIKREETGSPEYFPEIDESFWSEDLSNETSSDYFQGGDGGYTFQFPSSPAVNSTSMEGVDLLGPQIDHNGMDFWYDLFLRAGELPECIEF